MTLIQSAVLHLLQQTPDLLERSLDYAEEVVSGYRISTVGGKKLESEMPSQRTRSKYKVEAQFEDTSLKVSCTCVAYDLAVTCKHINTMLADYLAYCKMERNGYIEVFEAIDILQDALDGNINGFDYEAPSIDAKKATLIGTHQIGNDGWVTVLEDPARIAWQYASRFGIRRQGVMAERALEMVETNEESRYWHYKFNQTAKKQYDLQIKYDGQIGFSFKCTCGKLPACTHVLALLQKLTDHKDWYFDQFRNRDEEKNKFLASYGLNISDPEAADFNFTMQYGRLQAKVPSWAVNAGDTTAIAKMASQILPPESKQAIQRPVAKKLEIIDFELGFLLNLTGSRLSYMHYELEVVKVYPPKANGQSKVAKLDTHQPSNLTLLRALSNEFYALLHSLTRPVIETYAENALGASSHQFYGSYPRLANSVLAGIEAYYRKQLRLLWPHLAQAAHFYVLKTGRFSAANITRAKAVLPFIAVKPRLEVSEKFVSLLIENAHQQFNAANLPTNTAGLTATNTQLQLPLHNHAAIDQLPETWKWWFEYFYLNNKGHVTLLESDKDKAWFSILPDGLKRIPIAQKAQVMKTLIPALELRLGQPLDLPDSLRLHRILATPQPRIMVSEYMEKYLMLLPQFSYNEHIVDFSRRETEIWLQPSTDHDYDSDNHAQAIIERQTDVEVAFFEQLRPLHSSFAQQFQNDFFYLPFDQVMQNQWFIKTLQKLAEDNVPVLGIEKLKKFRYSSHKPKWEMRAGSQTDWFDLTIEVKFGDETVPLKTIRKAFASGQQVIMLNDGSLGLLPEEWLKQYGMLLKIGQEKQPGVMRLSKLHYTIIEALGNEIDDKKVLAELADKKQRLLAIDNIAKVAMPKGIKASLRPYQVSGFKWMNTLEQLGWGGCLADDMGLGKTLQTITFLQHLKTQFPTSTHLVVCPTSLLYNWENELRKFAPKLKFLIHYGLVRQLTSDEFAEHDIILTSYGLVRSDIELLKTLPWHYVILDESQAIKNPDALTTRALHLLPAKNRLILSGTPLQNNTYDLYSQFNFLNPGMLGSRDFFREEFANPIDKSRDAHKAELLRKMLHPFMLRRTKAQVAPDLPSRTETVLWCDMPKAQQQVYDTYKVEYRQALLKKIEENGMAKAGMLIIEGLLRLRQICNSPRLLKQPEYLSLPSAKIDELVREIQENTGGHKLLVFSQFTEMLHLIEAELKKLKIGYAYLDGSTPAAKRKEAVSLFQETESVRVFLISLKAGGVGLNLTAADYVYLVDPWWNPAAEQQAIDRTHRIGQKQKIFAYRMICRNTVEEKILALQNKKRQLAGDLVGEDEAIAKNLTREDVAFLFS